MDRQNEAVERAKKSGWLALGEAASAYTVEFVGGSEHLGCLGRHPRCPDVKCQNFSVALREILEILAELESRAKQFRLVAIHAPTTASVYRAPYGFIDIHGETFVCRSYFEAHNWLDHVPDRIAISNAIARALHSESRRCL